MSSNYQLLTSYSSCNEQIIYMDMDECILSLGEGCWNIKSIKGAHKTRRATIVLALD